MNIIKTKIYIYTQKTSQTA